MVAEQKGVLDEIDSYKVFKNFVLNLSVTNDCAEQKIAMISKYISQAKSEGNRQNILLVVKDNCKKIKLDAKQADLNKL